MSGKILLLAIVLILSNSPHAAAQQLETYGLSISGNSSWPRLDLGGVMPDLLDEKEQQIGAGIGLFAIWKSPLQSRLKTELEYSRRHYVIHTNSYPTCYGCRSPIIIGPRRNHTKMDILSLTLAPLFNLSALRLEPAYVFGGAELNYFLSHKTEIREETEHGTVVMTRNNMDRFWDHVGYGGTFGIGANLFELSGRTVSVDATYSFEINATPSGHRGIEARNRALEFGISVNL